MDTVKPFCKVEAAQKEHFQKSCFFLLYVHTEVFFFFHITNMTQVFIHFNKVYLLFRLDSSRSVRFSGLSKAEKRGVFMTRSNRTKGRGYMVAHWGSWGNSYNPQTK